jgi:hypothetical protein
MRCCSLEADAAAGLHLASVVHAGPMRADALPVAASYANEGQEAAALGGPDAALSFVRLRRRTGAHKRAQCDDGSKQRNSSPQTLQHDFLPRLISFRTRNPDRATAIADTVAANPGSLQMPSLDIERLALAFRSMVRAFAVSDHAPVVHAGPMRTAVLTIAAVLAQLRQWPVALVSGTAPIGCLRRGAGKRAHRDDGGKQSRASRQSPDHSFLLDAHGMWRIACNHQKHRRELRSAQPMLRATAAGNGADRSRSRSGGGRRPSARRHPCRLCIACKSAAADLCTRRPFRNAGRLAPKRRQGRSPRRWRQAMLRFSSRLSWCPPRVMATQSDGDANFVAAGVGRSMPPPAFA